MTPFDYKDANLFRFSLFSIGVRFKLCNVLLIWIHRRNTRRYFFGILENNSLLLESNELSRWFFFFFTTRNCQTSAKEKEKKKSESRTRHRSGWAMCRQNVSFKSIHHNRMLISLFRENPRSVRLKPLRLDSRRSCRTFASTSEWVKTCMSLNSKIELSSWLFFFTYI